MAITKFFKFVTPEVALTNVQDNTGVGSGGLYGNYTWYHSLVYGSAQRLARYREYDAMDADTDISVALDLLAEEICGNAGKNELPLKLVIEAGAEQYVQPSVVITLEAALRTWCKIEEWQTRLFPLARQVVKYGDAFFIRNKRNKFKKSIYVHPRNVTGAHVNELDHTDIRAWQIEYQPLGGMTGSNPFATGGYKAVLDASSGADASTNANEILAEDVIWYSLYNDMSDESPFGISVLRSIYKTFKQKELLEDAILIYRIQRAPERRVFYIDVGKMPANLVATHLEQIRNEIKQKKIPTQQGGKATVDSTYNPQSMSEDIFLASRPDGSGSKVEVLPGGQNLGELQDLEYFYKKQWRGLRIPQSYMDANTEGASPASDGKVGIAYMQEIKFSLYIERLQKAIEKTLDTEFKKFLAGANVKADTTIFSIKLPEPSNYTDSRAQAINAELLTSLTTADSIESISKQMALIKYGRFTPKEMKENERYKRIEMGLNPEGGVKDLPMIYNPEMAERGGFDGGMAGSNGAIGDDLGLGDDLDAGEDAGDEASMDGPGGKDAAPPTGKPDKK